MKKLLKLLAAMAAIMLLFAGCTDDPAEKAPEKKEVLVTSINILIDNYVRTDNPWIIFEGDHAKLTGSILPANATNKSYDLAITSGNSENYLELQSDGTLTALKDSGDDVVTVTITSKGKKSDGSFATATWNFKVTNDPEQITNPVLVVHNQNASFDVKTDNSTPALNGSNRLIVRNNENNARLDSAFANTVGNTFIYLNKPLKLKMEEDESTAVKSSISARIRITEGRDTETRAARDNNGVLIGFFNDPKKAPAEMRYVSARSAFGGAKRVVASRAADNGATADFSPTSLNTQDFNNAEMTTLNTTKKQYFRQQEYVYKVERESTATYNITIYESDGTTVIGTASRTGAGTQVHDDLAGDAYIYLGFLISGCIAEISDIVVMEGDTVIFETQKGTPIAQPTLYVDVATAAPQNPGDGFDYQAPLASVSSGVELTAEVFPQNAANKTVAWTVTGGGAAVNSSGLVSFTAAGTPIVRATAADVFGEFKFNIVSSIPAVVKVNVHGPDKIAPGNHFQYTATTEPELADNTVTWNVTGSDGSSSTTLATINTSSGELNAVSVGTVNVFATATNNVKSAAYVVIIDAAAAYYEWDASSVSEDFALATPAKDMGGGVYWIRGGGTINIKNTGADCATGSRFLIGCGNISAITATTNGAALPQKGEFDLSKKAKLSITYDNLAGNLLQVYVNNSSTSQNNSPHIGVSRIFNGGIGAGTTIPASGTLDLIIDPSAFTNMPEELATAFIQIRIGDGTNPTSINITKIKIDYE